MATVEQQNTGSSPAPEDPGSSIAHAWRALRHRNFRLFFSGQSISLIGTWMTRVATSWLVYRLTGSALLLGLVGFMGQIPTFLLAPFAGVWVDRLDRRQVLLWTQALAGVQSLMMAGLTLSRRITIHEILVLSAFQGLINAFDMPGRQAFLLQMVEDRQDLGNAIAINSSMVNLARLVGPSLAGVVIAAFGEGYCFLIDGLSYLAVIASLALMRIQPVTIARATSSMWTQLQEGWAYVSGFAPVRTILLLFAVVSLMGMPFVVLMPIFASQVLHGGPHTLGLLMGASGVGALVSALSLAVRKTVLGLGRMIPIAAAFVWRRLNPLRAFPGVVGFSAHDADCWFRHDAGHGCQQHHHSDPGARRSPRPRHELLHHGLRGHGPIWQPAGRRSGALAGRSPYRDDYRHGGHPGFHLVCHPAQGHPGGNASHLPGPGHSAGEFGAGG